MMFEIFKRHFPLDSAPTGLAGGASLSPDIDKLFAEFGGGSFNGGLYRVARVSDLDTWASRIGDAFREFKGALRASVMIGWAGYSRLMKSALKAENLA